MTDGNNIRAILRTPVVEWSVKAKSLGSALQYGSTVMMLRWWPCLFLKSTQFKLIIVKCFVEQFPLFHFILFYSILFYFIQFDLSFQILLILSCTYVTGWLYKNWDVTINVQAWHTWTSITESQGGDYCTQYILTLVVSMVCPWQSSVMSAYCPITKNNAIVKPGQES